MLRACVKRCKPFVLAAVLLALLLAALEVGLRTADSFQTEDELAAAANSLRIPSLLRHHQLKPGGAQQSSDTSTSVRINSWGFRGAEPTVPKPSQLFRVLILGDEMIFGGRLAEERTLATLVTQRLPELNHRQVEVLNASVPGYCPLLSYLYLKQSLAALQPDVVILCISMNDPAEDQFFRRITSTDPAGFPIACPHGRRADLKNRSRKSVMDRFAIGRWIKSRLGLLADEKQPVNDADDIRTKDGKYAWCRGEPPNWKVYFELTRQHLGYIRDLAKSWQGELMIVAIPAPWQISSSAGPKGQKWANAGIPNDLPMTSSFPSIALRQAADETRVQFLDLLEMVRAHPDAEKLFSTTEYGFSEAGHEFMAGAMVQFLKQKSRYDRRHTPAQPATGDDRSGQPLSRETVPPYPWRDANRRRFSPEH